MSIPGLSFGSLLSGVTGGMSTVYKWGAIAFVLLALCVGCFVYGKHLGDLQSKATIAEYTAKRDKIDLDLLGVNLITQDRIVTVYNTKIKVIHDNSNQTSNIALNSVTDHGLFSLGWVRTYNASARGDVPSAIEAADSTPSTVKANAGLATISDNNATCLEYKARAEAIIDFEQKVQENIANANKKAK